MTTSIRLIRSRQFAGYTGSIGYSGSRGDIGYAGSSTGSMIISDTFTGDGVTTSFLLSTSPPGEDYITVNIDGVSQLKSAYTLNNNLIIFTGVPIAGAIIEVRSITVASYGAITGLTYDTFTGTGNTTNFTLSTSPINKNYTLVTISGTAQSKNDYSISGSTITFTQAPALASSIEVTTFGPAQQLSLGYTGSQGVGFTGSTGVGFTGSTGYFGSTGFFGSRGYTGSIGGAELLHPFMFLSGI